MKAVWSFLDFLEGKMRAIAAISLMGMMLVTCSDVIVRQFHKPIFGSEEMVSFLLVFVIGFTLPFSHMERIHVGVEIVFRLLPPKVQILLKILTDFLSLLLMVTITAMMFAYWLDTKESGEVSMNLEFPEYWIIFAMACCFAVLNLFILRDLFIVKEIKSIILEKTKAKGDA